MEKPILIYSNFRGIAQVVRYLFAYMDIQYVQYELGKKNQINSHQFQIPEDLQINCKEMPYLIHEGICINELFPIFSYLCRRFKRQDLLGKTINDKAYVFQIMQRYIKRKSQKFKLMLKFLSQTKQSSPDNINCIRIKYLKNYYMTCQYLEPMMKKFKEHHTFILGYFSILDIIFFETFFYLDNLFGDEAFSGCSIVRCCKQYIKLFTQLQFYKKNKKILQAKPVVFADMRTELLQAFMNVWLGDKNIL